MALIKCKYCGHSVSDKAVKCPKCGGDLTQTEEPKQEVEVRGTNTNKITDSPQLPYSVEPQQPKKGNGLKILLVIFTVIAVGGIVYFLYWNNQQPGHRAVIDGIALMEIDGKKSKADEYSNTKKIRVVVEEEAVAKPEQYANESLATGTFCGSVDGKYPIVMRLTVDGNNIRGKYAYESTLRKYGDGPSSWFKLTGTKLPDGYVRLIAYLPEKTPGVDEAFERFELSFDDSGLSGHLENIKQGTVLAVDLYP